MAGGISSGVTTFVLGREEDGNRETRTFTNGQPYELDFSLAKPYSADETIFPYPTSD
jgi:hypothetical protein